MKPDSKPDGKQAIVEYSYKAVAGDELSVKVDTIIKKKAGVREKLVAIQECFLITVFM